MNSLNCYKAYDIRGRLGDELNEDIAYRIGRALAAYLQESRPAQTAPLRVVVGGDVRLSSESLKQALSRGLLESGCDVIDLGLTGTEEIYFAVSHLATDAGVEVTASHNPIDYNGMKLVREQSKPISGDTGLRRIQQLAEANVFTAAERTGSYSQQSVLEAYVDHLLGYIDLAALAPTRLLLNAGNGAAGHVVDALEQRFRAAQAPVELIKLHNQADGRFPNGIPNPLLPENRAQTAEAVLSCGAHMGVAWDGDFDRCFLFDEQGQFIEGYYIVGLLAQALLRQAPGSKIIHDPRLTWNSIEMISQAGGVAVQSKTGHAFIKERMRAEDAIYGGEMSAHHYFRDFAYCDSGMIPWLLVLGLISQRDRPQPLSQLVRERMAAYPCSGEINFRVADVAGSIEQIRRHFAAQNPLLEDHTDGLSMEFAHWRFNLRGSNTEPLLRLNVETRADAALLAQRTAEIAELLSPPGTPRGDS
ncbi:MAG: phosphomannomutase CpsG [Gammaproteobacteria bacterium]|nr:phosphomannomutase CpsG [Gammaproteobacteria bacterium]